MTEPTVTYGLHQKSPHKGSQAAVRAKYYPVGDGFTVVVVEGDDFYFRHHFYETNSQESAEALVRLLETRV